MEKIYQVEVVDFDSLSEVVEAEALSASEAIEIALSMVFNADYATILFEYV